MAEFKLGDKVVQLINQFTPEQVKELEEQVVMTKLIAKSKGNRRLADRHTTGNLKMHPDQGVVVGVVDKVVEVEGGDMLEVRLYEVAVDVGGGVTRRRHVPAHKLCLLADYDPDQEVEVPHL